MNKVRLEYNLMTNIPQYPVLGSIENIMKGNSELHNAKTRAQVTTSFGNIEYNIRPQLIC